MRLLIILLTLLPFTASAGMLGLDSTIEGTYNLETNKDTLTGEIGKTIEVYGLSITYLHNYCIVKYCIYFDVGS